LHGVDVVDVKSFKLKLDDFEELPVEPLDQRDGL
jgi:hypothetical protein